MVGKLCWSARNRESAGVAGAVLLPVAGLGIGVTQIVRGAVNTPEAVRELNKGRFWDQVSTAVL